MRILLLAYGSQGDVGPMLALGRGLKAAGYNVAVAAARNFAASVAEAGLDFEPFSHDVRELVSSEAGRAWLGGTSENGLREVANMRRVAHDATPTIAADLLAMVERSDVFISGLMTLSALEGMAQAQGKPLIAAWLAPMLPTRYAAAGVQAPLPRLNHPVNRWFGYFVEGMLWTVFDHPTNHTRGLAGLPPVSRGDFMRILNQTPSLCGFSPRVVPPPADWPVQHRVTGYWHPPAPGDWTPPADLRAFLDAGAPPVYIGFGSMTSADPAATARTLVEALTRSGARGLLHRGWAGLTPDSLPETIHLVDYAPHDWLFPRTAAVVHHGGAGTTAAALRAGVPSMIVPHMGDQTFWGRRVHELGVGARPLHRRKLTADGLARGIATLLNDTTMASRAAALGKALRAEDGVAVAVRALGELLDQPASTRVRATV